MPAPNHLNPEQRDQLLLELKREENSGIREIILILLLLNDGKTQKEVAEFLGISVNKVCYWCVHGDPDNLSNNKFKNLGCIVSSRSGVIKHEVNQMLPRVKEQVFGESLNILEEALTSPALLANPLV